jgi:hypothetical protein
MYKLAATVGLVLSVLQAEAALTLYEPFDYSNIGAPVSSNTPANWAHNVAAITNDTMVAPGNLPIAGGAESFGNSITNGGVGLGTRRLLGSTVTSGSLYFSVAFQMVAVGTGVNTTATNAIGTLSSPDNSTFPFQIVVKRTGAGTFQLGVKKAGSAAVGPAVFDANTYSDGQTLFFAGRYDFNSSTTSDDTVWLWINPDPSSFGGSEPATLLTTSTGTDAASGIDRFNFRQNGTTDAPAGMQWDELRVGDTWADVTPVPEPSTAVLAGLCILALVLKYRSRSKSV